MTQFNDNLEALESTDHIGRIELFDENDKLVATITNKPGSTGSVKVYHHLFIKYGAINLDAAEEGLEIYAEHTEDAASSPNKHPNIDRLFKVIEDHLSLSVKVY